MPDNNPQIPDLLPAQKTDFGTPPGSILDQLMTPVPLYSGLSSNGNKPPSYADQIAMRSTIDMGLKGFGDKEQFTAPIDLVTRYIGGWGASGYVGPDSEQYNADRQATSLKWINGIAKMTTTAGAEVFSGTLGLADGFLESLASIYNNGRVDFGNYKFSKMYNNVTNNAAQDFMAWAEDMFPHYSTKAEQNADWTSAAGIATNLSSANFWTDKLIKNAGFALGAVATGGIYGAALGALAEGAIGTKMGEALNWIMRSNRGIAASIRIERELAALGSGVQDVERSGKILEIINDEAKLAKLSMVSGRPIRTAEEIAALGADSAITMDNISKINTAFRNGLNSFMGSIGEANMEAIGGYREQMDLFLRDFQQKNGRLPTAEEKKKMEDAAGEANNYRWGMNVAVLTLSNAVQFPSFLKSYQDKRTAFTRSMEEIGVFDGQTKALRKGVLAAGVGDEYGVLATGAKRSGMAKYFSPLWSFTKEAAPEALEEFSQYAIQVGANEYAMRKYNGDSINIYSAVMEKGMPAMFKDKEGLESGILGFMTGGLMHKFTGLLHRDPSDNAKKEVTTKGLQAINATPVTKVLGMGSSPYIDAVAQSSVRAISIAEDTNKAVAAGDIQKTKDMEAYDFLNFITPRLDYGRKDLVEAELNQFHSKNMPIEQARKALQLPETVTSEQLDGRINRYMAKIQTVDNIRLFVAARNTYDRKTKKYKYNQNIAEDMKYYLYMIDDYDRRIKDMRNDLELSGLDMSDMLDTAESKGLREKSRDLDQIRNDKVSQLRDLLRKNPQLDMEDKDNSLLNKIDDIQKAQNIRELYTQEYLMTTKRTADRQDKPFTGIHTGTSDLEDLLNYEDLAQSSIIQKELDKYVISRRTAALVSKALGTVNKKDVDSDGLLTALKNAHTDKDSFLYKHDGDISLDMIEKLRGDLQDKYKNLAPIPTPYGDVNPVEDLKDVKNYPQYLAEAMREGIEINPELYEDLIKDATTLNDLEATVKGLMNKEPRTPVVSEIKRTMANTMMEPYDSVKKNFTANPEYSNVQAVSELLTLLKWMRKVYGQRTEVMNTKAFEGFLDLLDSRIAEAEGWLLKAAENNAKILQADHAFYVAMVDSRWRSLGIVIGKEREEALVLTPEQQKALDEATVLHKDLQAKQAIQKAAINSLNGVPYTGQTIVTDFDNTVIDTRAAVEELKEDYKTFFEYNAKDKDSVKAYNERMTRMLKVVKLTPWGAELQAKIKAGTIDKKTVHVVSAAPGRVKAIADLLGIDEANVTVEQQPADKGDTAKLLADKGKGTLLFVDDNTDSIAAASKHANVQAVHYDNKAAVTPADKTDYAKAISEQEAIIDSLSGASDIAHHIFNPVVYQEVAGLVGKDVLDKAIKNTYKAYKKEEPDFEKYLLGILETIRAIPDINNLKRDFQQSIQAVIDGPTVMMKDLKAKYGTKDLPGGATNPNAFQQGNDYDEMTANAMNSYPVLFSFFFRTISSNMLTRGTEFNAYDKYLSHGDVFRFYMDLLEDKKTGKLDYVRTPDAIDDAITFVGRVYHGLGAASVQKLVNSNSSLTDVYAHLVSTIDAHKALDLPVPSDRQLMSIIELIVHPNSKLLRPEIDFGTTLFLLGRVGSGKTSVALEYALAVIARMANSTISSTVLLAGDSKAVGNNLELALNVNQTAGKGQDIDDIITLLKTNKVPAGIRAIVIDEALRSTSKIKGKGGLAEALKDYNKTNRTALVLMLAGDPAQVQESTAKSDSILVASPHLSVAIPLATSFRSKVASINDLQAIYETAGSHNMTSEPMTFSSNVKHPWNAAEMAAANGVLYGVSGGSLGMSPLDRDKQMEQVLINRNNAKDSKGRSITKAIIINRNNPDQINKWLKVITDNKLVNTQIISYWDAQGRTFDEVYLDFGIDENDKTLATELDFNSAMYTSARGRNFIYLNRNNITTSFDPSLPVVVENSSKGMKDGSEAQHTKVLNTYNYLSGGKPITVTAPVVTPAAAAKPGTPPPPAGTPPSGPPQPHEDRPNYKVDDIGIEGKTAEDVIVHPDLDNNLNPTPGEEDNDTDDEATVPVEEEEEVDETDSQNPDTHHTMAGNGIIEETNDNNALQSITMSMGSPEGPAFRSYNAMQMIDPETDKAMFDKNNKPVISMVKVGEQVLILPMNLPSGQPGYVIMRETGNEGFYQQLGILSKEEEAFLKQYIPAFEAYHNDTTKKRYNHVHLTASMLKDVMVNSDAAETIYMLNSKVEGLPDFMKPTVTNAKAFKFRYDKSKPARMITNPVNGKDESKSINDVLSYFMHDYYTAIYTKPNGKLTRNAPTEDSFREDAVISIQVADKAMKRKHIGRNKSFKSYSDPIEVGKTYVVITYKKNKPQLIEMEGAVLSNRPEMTLHNNLYIQPMRDFMEATRTLSAALQDFILSPEGLNWEQKDFDELYKEGTKYQRLNNGVPVTFYHDDPSGFDMSSYLFNEITKRLVNFEFSRAKATEYSLPEKYKTFIHDLFEKLKDTNNDVKFLDMARTLRETQKVLNYVSDEQVAKATAAEKTTSKIIKLSQGIERNRVDAYDKNYIERDEAGEPRPIVRNKAQLAAIALARANVSIRVPNETKDRMLMNMERRVGNANLAGVKNKYNSPTAKDLLKTNFTQFGGKPEKGEEPVFTAENIPYYLVIDQYYKDSNNPRPLHPEPYQFENQVIYAIKKKLLVLPPQYATWDAVMKGAVKNERAAWDFMKTAVTQILDKFNFAEMGLTEYDKIFGPQGFDEKGDSITGMKINIPVTLSSDKQQHWGTSADISATNPYLQVSPAQRVHQMLRTHLSDVTPTSLGLRFTDGITGEGTVNTKGQKVKEEPVVEVTKEEEALPGYNILTPQQYAANQRKIEQEAAKAANIAANVPAGINLTPELVTEALKQVPPADLPVLRDSYQEMVTNYDNAQAEIKALQAKKGNVPEAETAAYIKKSGYKKVMPGFKGPDGVSYSDRAGDYYFISKNKVTIKTAKQIADQAIDNRIAKVKQIIKPTDAHKEYFAKDDKEKSTPEAITTAYLKVIEDNSNPELVDKVNALLQKYQNVKGPVAEAVPEEPATPPIITPYTAPIPPIPPVAPEDVEATAGEAEVTSEEDLGTGTNSTLGNPDNATQQITDNLNKVPPHLRKKNFFDKDPTGNFFDKDPMVGKNNKIITQSEAAARRYLYSMVPGLDADKVSFLMRGQFIAKTEKDAWGHIENGAIEFSNRLGDDTYPKQVIKHEAFHAVFDYFINGAYRTQLMDAAIKFYNLQGMTEYKIEEFLADEFDKKDYTGFLPRIIAQLFNYLRKMFNLISKEQYFIEDFFQKVEAGYFKTPSDTPINAERFKLDMAVYDHDDKLYKQVRSQFVNDFHEIEMYGNFQELPGGVYQYTPLNKGQTLQVVRDYYKKQYTEFMEGAGTKPAALMTVEEQAELKRLSILNNDENIRNLTNLIFPSTFSYAKSKSIAGADNDYQKGPDDAAKEAGMSEADKEKAQIEESTLKAENMTMTIVKQDEINPVDTISNLIKGAFNGMMQLHQGNVEPVNISTTFFMLLNHLKTLPYHITPTNAERFGYAGTDIDRMLENIQENFKSFIQFKSSLSPEMIIARKSLTNFLNKPNSVNYDDMLKAADRIQNYFTNLYTSEINPPTTRQYFYAMNDIDNLIKTMRADDGAHYKKEYVKHILWLLKNNAPEVPDNGNPSVYALYKTLKSYILMTYEHKYTDANRVSDLITGKTGTTNILRTFSDNVFFRTEQVFIYKDLPFVAKRNSVNDDNVFDYEHNSEWFDTIIKTVNRKYGKDSITLDELNAVYRRSKSLWLLGDMGAAISSIYKLKPFKSVTTFKGGIPSISINPVTTDQSEDAYYRQMVNLISTGIFDKTAVDKVVYDQSFMKNSRDATRGNDSGVITTREGKEKFVTEFMKEIGMRQQDLYFEQDEIDHAFTGAWNIASILRTTMAEDGTAAINLAEGDNILKMLSSMRKFIRSVTGTMQAVDIYRSLSTYVSDNKQLSALRTLSTASSIVNSIVAAADTDNRLAMVKFVERYPHFDPQHGESAKFWVTRDNISVPVISPMHYVNPLNPLSIGSHLTAITGFKNFDSAVHRSKSKEYSTFYHKETQKDTLHRLFVTNFLVPFTQPHIFSINEHTNQQGDFTSIMQPFYIMSDRQKTEGANIKAIPYHNSNEHIANILFRSILKPGKDYEAEDGYKPFNLTTYHQYHSPFEKTADGNLISHDDIEELAKLFKPRLDELVTHSSINKQNEKLQQAFKEFMKLSTVQGMLIKVRVAMAQEADRFRDTIKEINRLATEYKTISAEGDVKAQLRQANAFLLPSKDDILKVYRQMVKSGVMDVASITQLSKGLVVENKGEGGGFLIVEGAYDPDIYNYNVNYNVIRPILHAFMTNFYVHSVNLNNLVGADESLFNKLSELIKRMALVTANGEATHNINGISDLRDNSLHIGMISDVTIFRDISKPLDIKNRLEHVKNHNDFPENTTIEQAKTIIDALEKQPMMTPKQNGVLNKAYNLILTSGDETLVKDYHQRLVDKDNQVLGWNKQVIGDSQGLISERGLRSLQSISGPGSKMLDILKPVIHGIDKYGVPRTSKFSVENLSDEQVAMFPNMLTLRIDMDFGSLKRKTGEITTKDGKTKTINLFDEANRIERKRIRLMHTSALRREEKKRNKKLGLPDDTPSKVPHDRMEPHEMRLLDDLYSSPLNKPMQMVVPPSAAKYGTPAAMAEWDPLTESFGDLNHEQGFFDVHIEDFRIQQKPSDSAEDKAVSLFTQLFYMTNMNGNNQDEMRTMTNHLQQLMIIQADSVYELGDIVPFTPSRFSRKAYRENRDTAAKIFTEKNKDAEVHSALTELLKKDSAMVNTPAGRNSVSMSMFSSVSNAATHHRFSGLKVTQASPVGREISEILIRNGLKLPEYDDEKMEAEVYLPDIFSKKIKAMFPGQDLSEAEIIARIPLLLGYRVPSTGLNSAVRVRVIGFYPSTEKINVVVAPADITLIMGSDFDADAMFMAMLESLPKGNKEAKALIKSLYGDSTADPNMPIGFNLEKTKDGFVTKEVPGFLDKIKDAYIKSEKGSAQRKVYRRIYGIALRNHILNQYIELLVKKENKQDVKYPINFDKNKSITNIDSTFNQRAFNLSETFKIEWTKAYNDGSIFTDKETSRKLDSDRDALLRDPYYAMSPMSTAQQQADAIEAQQLVGTFANATKQIAYVLSTINKTFGKEGSITVTPDNVIKIGDVTYGVLGTRLEDGSQIADVYQRLVNAFIDGTKEGIASVMNVTEATGNALNGLLQLGVTEIHAQSIMNQPILRDFTRRFGRFNSFNKRALYKSLYSLGAENKEAKDQEFDTMKKADRDAWILEAVTKGSLTYDNINKFEKYRLPDNAETDFKNGKLTVAELQEFINHQAAIIDIFSRADAIGEELFQYTQIINIINDFPILAVDRNQFFTELVSGLYETVKQRVKSNGKSYSMQTVRMVTDANNQYIPNNDNIVKGLDVFKVPTIRTAFDIVYDMYVKSHSIFDNELPLVEALATVVTGQMGISLSDNDRFENLNNIKQAVTNMFYGSVSPTVVLPSMKEEPFSVNTAHDGSYKANNIDYTLYNDSAFVARMHDEMINEIYNDKYKNNIFIQSLKFQSMSDGTRYFNFKKTINLEPAEKQMLNYAFTQLPQSLQEKLYKYCFIVWGLQYGATKFSEYVSEDLQLGHMKAVSEFMEAVLSSESATIESDVKTAETDAITGDTSTVREDIISSNMVDHLSGFLSVALPAHVSSLIKRISMYYVLKSMGKDAGAKLESDEETAGVTDDTEATQQSANEDEDRSQEFPGNKHNLTDTSIAGIVENEENPDDGTDSKIGANNVNDKEDSLVNELLKYDAEADTYYTFFVTVEMSSKRSIDTMYPQIGIKKAGSSGREQLYYRVNVVTTPEQGNRATHKVFYVKWGNARDYKITHIPEGVFKVRYNVEEMYPKNTPVVMSTPDEHDVLLMPGDFKKDPSKKQYVHTRDIADFTGATSMKVYEILEQVAPPQSSFDPALPPMTDEQRIVRGAAERDAISKELTTLYDNKKKKVLSDEEFNKKALKLKTDREKFYIRFKVKDLVPHMKGVENVKIAYSLMSEVNDLYSNVRHTLDLVKRTDEVTNAIDILTESGNYAMVPYLSDDEIMAAALAYPTKESVPTTVDGQPSELYKGLLRYYSIPAIDLEQMKVQAKVDHIATQADSFAQTYPRVIRDEHDEPVLYLYDTLDPVKTTGMAMHLPLNDSMSDEELLFRIQNKDATITFLNETGEQIPASRFEVDKVEPKQTPSQQILVAFAGRLSRQFNIPVLFVSKEQASGLFAKAGKTYRGNNAFFLNGKSYAVIGKATGGNLVHEVFGHPFLEMIKKENPDLYASLINASLATEGIKDYIKRKYKDEVLPNGELTETGNKEAVLRVMELEADNQIKAGGGLRALLEKFWNAIKTMLGISEEKFVLNANTTVQSLVEQVLEGKTLSLDLYAPSGLHETAAGTSAQQDSLDKVTFSDMSLVPDPTGVEQYKSALDPTKVFIRGTESLRSPSKYSEEERAEYFAKERFKDAGILNPSLTDDTTKITFNSSSYTFRQLKYHQLLKHNNERIRGSVNHAVMQYGFDGKQSTRDKVDRLAQRKLHPDDPTVVIYDGIYNVNKTIRALTEPDADGFCVMDEVKSMLMLDTNSGNIAKSEHILYLKDLNIATTADLLIVNKMGEYGVPDFKFGNLSAGDYGKVISDIASKSRETDTSINAAYMDVMMRMMIIKVLNPDAKFFDSPIIKIDALGNKVIPMAPFDIETYLPAIENWVHGLDPKVHAKYKAAGVFNVNNYWGSSRDVKMMQKEMNESAGVDMKEAAQDSVKMLNILATQALFLSTQSRGMANNAELRQEKLAVDKKLEDITKTFMALQSRTVPAQSIFAFGKDISQLIGVNQNMYDQRDPTIVAFGKYVEDQQFQADAKFNHVKQIYKKLSDAVVEEHRTGQVKWGRLNLNPMSSKFYVGDGTGVYDFCFVEDPYSTGTRVRFTSKTKDTAKWGRLTMAQRKYLEYTLSLMEELYNKNVANVIVSDKDGKQISKAVALGLPEKWDPENAMLYLPMLDGEYGERKNAKLLEKLGVHMKFSLYTNQQKAANYKAGLPVNYMDAPDDESLVEKTHSLNMEHIFMRFTDEMYKIEYMEEPYAFGQGIKNAITSWEFLNPERKIPNMTAFLDSYLHSNVEQSKQRKEIALRESSNAKGYPVNITDQTIADRLKGMTSFTTMAFQPVLAVFNSSLINLLNYKGALINDLSKMFGVKDVSFGHKEWAMGIADYFAFKTSLATGTYENNKTYQFIKMFNLSPEDVHHMTRKKDMNYVKGSFTDRSLATMLQTVSEEQGFFSLMSAMLHGIKVSKGKEKVSIYDSYKIITKTDQGVSYKTLGWTGGTRGYVRTKFTTDAGVNNDRLDKIEGLTSEEIQNLKKLTAQYTGDYRKSEETQADKNALWSLFWQFKRYMNRYLKNAFETRKEDSSIGKFIETGEVLMPDGTKVSELSWIRQTTEGWMMTTMYKLINTVLHFAPETFKKSALKMGWSEARIDAFMERYKWSSLSEYQKNNVIKGAINISAMMAAYAFTVGWDDDDALKRRLQRLLQDLGEGGNPLTVVSAARNTFPAFTKMGNFATYGTTYLMSALTDNRTKQGNLRGEANFVNLIGPIAAKKQIADIFESLDK